jgi:MFS family permease
MLKNLPSAKTIFAGLALGAAVGFFAGGGWQIVFAYSAWHYEITMHANDVEQTLAVLNWFSGSPAIGTAAGALIGVLLACAVSKLPTEKAI